MKKIIEEFLIPLLLVFSTFGILVLKINQLDQKIRKLETEIKKLE